MIKINGQVYGGNNISIFGNQLMIDGVIQKPESPINGIIRIEVDGNLSSIKTDANVTVNGNVSGDINAGGSVTTGNVMDGDVDAGGSVTCEDVHGDVDAGGSVKCYNVEGDIDAGGSVSYTK